jgi:TNF receptor-associated factor 4
VVLRKDLAEHEEDTQQHLQLAVDTVHKQQITIRKQQFTLKEQDSMLAHLRSTELPMIYKLDSYDKHKTTKDEVFSPAFYTSPGGYKMCINVYANGHRDGNDTHVSVFACLMKGENDNHLPWPFTGTITIELLNQLEDDNHYLEDITFPPDEDVSQQVVDEEIPIQGWGEQEFIPHSDLGYNAAENYQYLKDDCLYFRISVDIVYYV